MTWKKLREAEERYQAGSPARPDCAEYDAALRLLEELITGSDLAETVEPETVAQALNLRWHIRFLRGDLRGALDDLSEAIALLPRFGAALYNRGFVRRRLGRFAEAREDFEAALKRARETGDVGLADAAEVHLAELDRR